MKMTILPKAIYMFSAISTKIPMMFLTKIKNNQPETSYGNTKDHE
jgi:hypothetical protein